MCVSTSWNPLVLSRPVMRLLLPQHDTDLKKKKKKKKNNKNKNKKKKKKKKKKQKSYFSLLAICFVQTIV